MQGELQENENIEAIELLYDSLPDVLSQLIRTEFILKEGCKFIVADFSAIAWLAGEKWRMDVFKNNGDIYYALASQMKGDNVVKLLKKLLTSSVRPILLEKSYQFYLFHLY